MNLMDVWNSGAFDMVEMTVAANKQPYAPGFISSLGLFREYGIATTDVGIKEENGRLKLVQSSERGEPLKQEKTNKRTLRKLSTIHIKDGATIKADEIQNVVEFGDPGGQLTLRSIEAERDDRLAIIRPNIEATKENLKLGAVMGKIYDADGAVLYDLFDEFNVDEPTAIDLNLDGSPNVQATAMKAKRRIGRALKVGMMPFQVHALCGDDLFDALVTLEEIKRAYERQQESAFLRENHAWDSVTYAGIQWHNYRGFDFDEGDDAPETKSGTGIGIDIDECHFFPAGVPGLFECPYAPADWWTTVNTKGLPIYAAADLESEKQTARAIELECQSNPLPFCTRPAALIKGTRT